ncbi:hypothetical protein BURC_02876 [Burkholderiaceae bacterium]|nr:hypothetical protein BURC_02876 [Burkholderiaceae bacterium]
MDNDEAFAAVVRLIGRYFDGLHFSDTAILAEVFHPQAHYACATGGSLLQLDMAAYFPIVDRRPSPASKGESRSERIVSIEFAGPVTAMVRAECTIAPKRFSDLLTLVHVDGRWQIISKVFHYELMPQPGG